MTDRIDRRSFLAKSAVAGAGIAAGSVLAACGSSGSARARRPLRAARPGPIPTASVRRHPEEGRLARPSGVDAEEKGFSPTQGTFDEVGIMYARTVFDTLMILDANGLPQPNLAQSVTSNADGTVWTITMRPNLKFHNGAACDAAPWPPTSPPTSTSLLTGPALTPMQSIVVDQSRWSSPSP